MIIKVLAEVATTIVPVVIRLSKVEQVRICICQIYTESPWIGCLYFFINASFTSVGTKECEFKSSWDLTDYGRHIRETVGRWTGLPVSVGIGPTKTLAKVANRAAKKDPALDGVLDFAACPDPDALLERFPVEEVWGIGRRYATMGQGVSQSHAGVGEGDPGGKPGHGQLLQVVEGQGRQGRPAVAPEQVESLEALHLGQGVGQGRQVGLHRMKDVAEAFEAKAFQLPA